MILGLLYKTKKKTALAVQHLSKAKLIASQYGQTPMAGENRCGFGGAGLNGCN